MTSAMSVSVERLFYEISREWFEEHDISYESQSRGGVFSAALTIWLMLLQRLCNLPLQGAAIELLRSDDESIFVELNKKSKKLAFGDLSSNSGGLSRARDRLESGQISDLIKHCESKLRAKLGNDDPIYLLDGTCLTTAYSKTNKSKYPPPSTGAGTVHYPRLRLVTAHRLADGLALKPVYGEMKQSEQALTWQYLSSLPAGSTVMGDRNFGVFSVAFRATSLGKNVLFRLNEAVFQRVAGKQHQANCDISATWHPSGRDRRTTPEIPKDAAIEGRWIKCSITEPGFRAQAIYFFTTLTLSAAKIAALYLRRQRIETHISQLKQTLKLEFISAKTPTRIEKEINIAFLTFNLLSAIMAVAAQQNGLPFERISFTAARRIVNAFSAQIHRAKDNNQSIRIIQQMNKAFYQTKLPKRTKRRSYPRVIKRNKSKFHTQVIVKNQSDTDACACR